MVRETNGAGQHLSLNPSVSAPPSHARTSRLAGAAPHLSSDDIDELRTAIERSLCEGELHDVPYADIDEDLRKALCIACAKARLQRVRAEQLLIDVKRIWMSIPSMLTTRTGARLNEIVTACIAEYYAKGDTAAT